MVDITTSVAAMEDMVVDMADMEDMEGMTASEAVIIMDTIIMGRQQSIQLLCSIHCNQMKKRFENKNLIY